jgi:hypothetical protein
MKKLILTFLASSFITASYAGYFDNWSNNDLCGWMNSSSVPKNIQTEVSNRELLCYGGVAVDKLPTVKFNNGQFGTSFPSPDPDLIEELHSKHNLGPKSKMGGY